MPLSSGQRWSAWIVLALAACLRFASLGFDLDLRDPDRSLPNNHSDARRMVEEVQGSLARGDLAPGTFLLRGPAGFLVFRTVDAVAVQALAAADPRGRAGVLRDLELNPSLLALLHRWIAACAGVATVFLVMRFMRREFDAASATCAGLVLAVAYLHVRDSHLGTVDVLWGLALVLALDACFALVADGRPWRYAAAGLLVGAATATKYFSAVLVLHLFLAHRAAVAAARAAGRPAPGLARLGLAVTLVPAGFLALFPGFFLGSARELWTFVTFQVEQQAPHADAQGILGLLDFHLQKTLAVGLGETALLAALAGLVLAWRRDARGRLLVLSVLGVTPTLVVTDSFQVRFGMSLLILLALPAGIALAALVRRLPRALGALAVLLALAPSLVRALALDRVWQRTDTRLQIMAELRRRCLPSDEVLAVGLYTDNPKPLRPFPFEYVNYLFATYSHKLALADVLSEPPRWILWGSGAAIADLPDGPALKALVDERYRQVLRLENGHAGALVASPSPLTVPRALEVPYESPWLVDRPGPTMTLYERVEAQPPLDPGARR